MRIVQIETFGRGGLAHYAENLCRALAERGHDVTLVTAAGFERGGVERPSGFRVVQTIGRAAHRRRDARDGALVRLVRRAEALLDSLRVALLVRRLRPDVVHLHCTNPIALAYLVWLRLVGHGAVATAHVVTPHEPIAFERAIYRGVHAFSRTIIAHSEFDRQRLLDEFALAPARVVVIPHGEYGFFSRGRETPDRARARRDLGLATGDEVALFFGYVREYKGLDLLLDAWSAVAQARPAARLVVAGDPVRLSPERRRELAEQAERLGAVCRLGYVPFEDVSRYFAAADVLVMPYRRVSQSGVLFLALSLGVPVVATAVGGLPELLEDGESAVLVPPGSVPALAAGLVRALGDAALRERLAAGGLGVAERHSWPAIAERTEVAFSALGRH